jgi:transcriptional regulator with XRE-family HTH domain
MNIGEVIKQKRLEKGLSLEEVGRLVGVGKSTVRKWENGIIQNMRRDKIAKISSALDIPLGVLMGWISSEEAQSKPTRESTSKALETALRSFGYIKENEALTPELLSDINVALKTVIELHHQNKN